MKDTTGIVAAANVAKNGPNSSKGGSEEILTVARSRLNTAMTALPGWHVNVRVVGEDDTALQAFAITPATPMRVWG